MVSSLTSCASPLGPPGCAGPPLRHGGTPSCLRPPGCSPLLSPPSHSNSWRRRPPSPQSPRSPCRHHPSSQSIAAWCRSSMTRTGYAPPPPRPGPARGASLPVPPLALRWLPGGMWVLPGRTCFLSGPQHSCLKTGDLCGLPHVHRPGFGSGSRKGQPIQGGCGCSAQAC